MSSRLVTSALCGVACASPAHVSCAFWKSRSAASTRAPVAAKRCTAARPIPDPAPVTTTNMAGSVARMRIARVIQCVDAHAEGEPSRIIVGGVLDVPGTTMLEKARWLEREGDWLRRLCLFEPRGSAPLSADLVLPSAHPEADAGFIIMESSSYEGMSGTNTINTAAVLLETGMVELVEPVTSMVLEAPAGLVRVSAEVSGGVVGPITFENVPSFCTALDAVVEVPDVGTLSVDVAYGGAWCAFVDAAALGFAIVPGEARDLGELGERIRPHASEQLAIEHPLEEA